MENSSGLRAWSRKVLVASLFLSALAVGCGGKPYQQLPEVEITSAKFETHPVGGPNFHLLCELEIRYQTGDQQLEIVETVGDDSFVPFAFTGAGTSQVPVKLMGTLVNDGDTSRMDELLKRLPALLRLPQSLAPDETATFLEYEGLDGISVRYELRLR